MAETRTAGEELRDICDYWERGLDCADHPSAMFFGEHYESLKDDTSDANARTSVAAILRYLHESDHTDFLPIAERLGVDPLNPDDRVLSGERGEREEPHA